jgi:hypothetical protein
MLVVSPATVGVRADEAPEDDPGARRRLRAQELTIRLLEEGARHRGELIDSLFDLVRAQGTAFQAARSGTAVEVEMLNRRIDQLQQALRVERDRNGVDENELAKQPMAEQERHTGDVQQLVEELTDLRRDRPGRAPGTALDGRDGSRVGCDPRRGREEPPVRDSRRGRQRGSGRPSRKSRGGGLAIRRGVPQGMGDRWPAGSPTAPGVVANGDMVGCASVSDR